MVYVDATIYGKGGSIIIRFNDNRVAACSRYDVLVRQYCCYWRFQTIVEFMWIRYSLFWL